MTTARVYPLTTRPFGRHPPHRSCEGTHDHRRRNGGSQRAAAARTATAIRTARRGSAAVVATSRSAPVARCRARSGCAASTCGKPSRDALASLNTRQLAIGLAVADRSRRCRRVLRGAVRLLHDRGGLLRRHDHRRSARPHRRHQARAADPAALAITGIAIGGALGASAVAGRAVARSCWGMPRWPRPPGRPVIPPSPLDTFLLQYVPSVADRHRGRPSSAHTSDSA